MKRILVLTFIIFQFTVYAQIGVSYYNGQPLPTQFTFIDKGVLSRSATASTWSGFSINWQYKDENNVVFEPALNIGWVKYDAVEMKNFYGTPEVTNFNERVLDLSVSVKVGYVFFSANDFIHIIPMGFLNGHLFGKEPFEYDNSSQLLGDQSSSESGFRMGWGFSVRFRSPKIPGLYLESGWEGLKKREEPINYLSSIHNRWFVAIGYRFPKLQ